MRDEDRAKRGELRLHLTDDHLEPGSLALALRDAAKARAHYDAARQLIDETGYHTGAMASCKRLRRSWKAGKLLENGDDFLGFGQCEGEQLG